MTDLSRLQQLMSEIGPALDLAGVAEYGVDGTWALVLDADTEIWAEWDAGARCLVLTAELGVPPPEGREQLYETLLVYNHQRERTGGVRIALTEPGGPVVQSLDLAVDDLSLTRLAQVVSAYLEVLRAWREVLRGGLAGVEGSAAPAPEAAPNVPPGTSLLKV